MILVDTSVWVHHLRKGHAGLERLLDAGVVLSHPYVVAELALGNLSRRAEVIGYLAGLPQALTASVDEVLTLVNQHQLYGLGIGYVDAQLLAAARLTPGTLVWTADKRLNAAASRLGCAADAATIARQL